MSLDDSYKELFGKRMVLADGNIAGACGNRSSSCSCPACTLARVADEVAGSSKGHPYLGDSHGEELAAVACNNGATAIATDPIFRIHTSELSALIPRVDAHEVGTFELGPGNKLVRKVLNWEKLSDYYTGTLAINPDQPYFWTTQDVSEIRTAQDLVSTRLHLGLDDAYPESVLLKLSDVRCCLPTEVEGFGHPYFGPMQISAQPSSGLTMDLRDLRSLRRGLKEFVANKVDTSNVLFKHLSVPPDELWTQRLHNLAILGASEDGPRTTCRATAVILVKNFLTLGP